MDELITLEDYVPFSFAEYNKQNEREEFLKTKGLFVTITEMANIIQQKCKYADDSVKAYNSVIIEWIADYSEFERIIHENSILTYENMKNNDYTDFNDLLDMPPYEKENEDFIEMEYNHEKIGFKDDSSIKYPNFKKITEIFEKYPSTLLACYLAYLV